MKSLSLLAGRTVAYFIFIDSHCSFAGGIEPYLVIYSKTDFLESRPNYDHGMTNHLNEKYTSIILNIQLKIKCLQKGKCV